MYLRKPFFEIEQWPEEELLWWAACFSIEDNKEKPIIRFNNKDVTVEDTKEGLRRVLMK